MFLLVLMAHLAWLKRNLHKIGKPGEGKNTEEKVTDSAEGSCPETGRQEPVSSERDSVILRELRKLRQEHAEAADDNKRALARLENNMKELMERTTSLEQKAEHMEERIGNTEDRTTRLERSAAFLLQQTAKLSVKCDDFESRLRRNNIRIHGIPEGAEKNDTIGFVTGLIKSKIQITDDTVIRIERAHRSLVAKPKDSAAPPRAIIIRFLDYKVKEYVIRQAWKQMTTYEGQTIYFNQDYTTEVQRKRKQVRDVIKKLKEKKVKAQSPYPAQLKVFLDSGTKTFSTLMEAAPMLKDMGIDVQEDGVERLQRVMTRGSWTTATGQKGRQRRPHITEADLKALME
uniref:L1 transposable element RRM domain-containing protein n=1 Tax=Seriola dumerili TaxID=41447 RepID=A0A3B4URD3_SERDU